jgi:chromosome transmission fidelity protein 4
MGSITVHHGDDRNSTIDIQFTDVNSHRPITFKDNSNFIIGSLGEDGAIFASDLKSDEDDDEDDDDLEALDGLNMSERTKQAVRRDRKNREAKKDNSDPTGSTIYFHRFETFSSIAQKDWVVTLPDGELALGAATGEGWAAVMTR